MSITVTGLTELYAKLGAAATFDILDQPMQRGLFRLEAYMKDYPAAPATSRYRRTGTLGRRWTTRIDHATNSLTGRVGNNVGYARYVQSAAYQTRFHTRTGWRTDERAVRDNETAIVDDFERTIQGALKE